MSMSSSNRDALDLEHLLATLADHDNDEQQRWEAAQALGTLGDRQALEPLVTALSDEAASVRLAAGLALGDLGDGQAAVSLLDVLRRADESEGVVQVAGLALSELDETALSVLIEALHNPQENPMLKTYAASAIGEIGSHSSGQRPSQNSAEPDAKSNGPNSQPDQDEIALAALVEAIDQDFNWQDSSVRAGIVKGLGAVGQRRFGSNETPELLLNRVLRNEEEDIVVRCEAAWALGRLGSPTARQELIAVAKLVEQETGESEQERELLRQNIEVALEQARPEPTT